MIFGSILAIVCLNMSISYPSGHCCSKPDSITSFHYLHQIFDSLGVLSVEDTISIRFESNVTAEGKLLTLSSTNLPFLRTLQLIKNGEFQYVIDSASPL